MNITNESPKNCPQCGAEYRHIQAPHKPLGVSMMMVCDCTPIITNENGITVTRLVSPKQLEHEKARAAALKKMLIALPYMRHAAKDASEKGKVFIGILSVNEDGSVASLPDLKLRNFSTISRSYSALPIKRKKMT